MRTFIFRKTRAFNTAAVVVFFSFLFSLLSTYATLGFAQQQKNELAPEDVIETHDCVRVNIVGAEDSSAIIRSSPSSSSKNLGYALDKQEYYVLESNRDGQRFSSTETCSKTWLKLSDAPQGETIGWVPASQTDCKVEWNNCNDTLSPIVGNTSYRIENSDIEDEQITLFAKKKSVLSKACEEAVISNTNGQRINVRERPALVAEIVGQVREGSLYEVIGFDEQGSFYQDNNICSSTWLNIRSLETGRTGWITSVYTDCFEAQNSCDNEDSDENNTVDLIPIPDDTNDNENNFPIPSKPDLECPQIRVNFTSGDPVNIRQEPSLNANIIGAVFESEAYNVLEIDKRAAFIQDDDRCSTAWLRLSIPDGRDGWITSVYTSCTEVHTPCATKPDEEEEPQPVVQQCPTSRPRTWPVPNNRRVGQAFGVFSSYMSCGTHSGIDVSDRQGNPILAAGSGRVVHVGHMWLSRPGTGRGPNAVIIDHGNGQYSTYGHNQRTIVREGQCVRAGQQIGTIGSLGYSSGPHLHYEVVENARFTGDWQTPFRSVCQKYVNPMNYF